jgi:hypothetical protein
MKDLAKHFEDRHVGGGGTTEARMTAMIAEARSKNEHELVTRIENEIVDLTEAFEKSAGSGGTCGVIAQGHGHAAGSGTGESVCCVALGRSA